MDSKIILFLTELYKRFSLTSPKFFQVLQKIGIVASVITGVPSFLEGQGVVLPEPFASVQSTVVAVAGVILWIVSKLPVTDPQDPQKNGKSVSKSEALPFSNKKTKLKRA